MKTEKSFEEINIMLSKGKNKMIRKLLIDENNGKIKKEYQWDLNHAWYCIGDAEFKMGKYKESIDSFKKSYKSNNKDIQCLIAIGNCFEAMKKPKKSEEILRKALEKGPKGKTKAAIIFNLGNALFDQKKYKEAASLYYEINKRRDEIGKRARKNLKIILSR